MRTAQLTLPCTKEMVRFLDLQSGMDINLDSGDVMEFRYASALQSAFLGGGISNLADLNNQGKLPKRSAHKRACTYCSFRLGAQLVGQRLRCRSRHRKGRSDLYESGLVLTLMFQSSSSLNYQSPSNTYTNAQVFSLYVSYFPLPFIRSQDHVKGLRIWHTDRALKLPVRELRRWGSQR